ncbi:MAG: DUF2497 domain-containing protein [Hyphomicrobiaceae bacterium]|nr:DUF2497 domain-containing protein [Hyphomicrobiaceae bacterium]
MTKSDATGAQSLEEILAQIKKSVAGEAGPTRSGGAASAGGEASGRPIDGGLSARLAGVLKDTGSPTPPDDETGLAAGDEKAEGPARPAKLMEARRQAADPLWFLRQPAGTVAQDGAPTPTPPETGAASKEEEVRLSRPQDLRASLPPLFGAEDQPLPLVRIPAAETQPIPPQTPVPDKHVGPALDNVHTVKTQPLIPAPDMERSSPDVGPAEAKPAPEVQAAAPSVAALTEPSQDASRIVEAKLDDGLQPQAQTASMAMPGPVAEPAGDTSPPPAAGLQGRSLEQVIGELLEPVIRHWLQANLPRLTEEVVRKEVARALAAERPTSVV